MKSYKKQDLAGERRVWGEQQQNTVKSKVCHLS